MKTQWDCAVLNLWNLQVQPQIYLSHYLKKWVLAWLPNIAQKMSYYIAKGELILWSIVSQIQEHGPSACGMAFRVRDAQYAYHRAIELGAKPVEIPTSVMELRLPAIRGIGGAPLYLIDRFDEGKSIYDIDFEFIDGVDINPVGYGFKVIDHLTHNVYLGRMDYWAGFYEKLFNF